MIYLIGKLRIGAKLKEGLNWDKNLIFFDSLYQDIENKSTLIIVGNVFDDEISTTPVDFMTGFNILLKFQNKCNIKICSNPIKDSYTFNLAQILGIEFINSELYRSGIETKKIGNTYSLGCPYYLEGEKKKSKFGYFKGKEDFMFIENKYSAKNIEVKITKETDLQEIKKITELKKEDIINIELDKNVISQINDEDHTDLILILNKENVKVKKHKEEIKILETENIDFTPNKNFYLKMLISIIKNKDISEYNKKKYLKTLKEIS